MSEPNPKEGAPPAAAPAAGAKGTSGGGGGAGAGGAGGLNLILLLGSSQLFSGLGERHLARVAGIGIEERFERNQMIFREGEVGQKFYLVLDGAVRISRQVPGLGEEALAILRQGQAFGEMSLIDEGSRSADALAHEPCRLLVIEKEALEDLLFVDRDLAYDFLWKMVRMLSSRLRETTNKMTFLSFAGRFE
jgi:CRP/FNR family transcriptional regulator, cyclic AMP receptor protein